MRAQTILLNLLETVSSEDVDIKVPATAAISSLPLFPQVLTRAAGTGEHDVCG